ncbi:Lrp/AsnC family transcriptional regulator [Candidatus Woesearchaeota archaeon]|mgnify:FL=1|nr:Lrp/AsnC family transcriptional regulator [Candidatus Woesearchaeota archaeon]MBT4111096.1 Lrp/AsnC family transcriptional regulator [Candidatus Woesearchaeota archaeon]MBT4335740.1 Lrp/AsnC family transcriptional regulator [Candidatus Woesearchaeota archaeon]MBT4469263.1 Lrp/AsnC family transcriptional regulator [Candidatus Woesearchaeota archaeon]MBT6744235.1 Lrp/AsnC family transcriptional regulator [Candidatus Woesearchaeota archaeon]
MKLDKKDLQILFELDQNSRQSINSIAKKTKLSRDVVNYRIKQLEKNKIISGYFALIDFNKLGYQAIRLYLELKNTTTELDEEIVAYFLKEKDVFTIYRTDGKFDLALGFLVKDLNVYQKVYENFLKKYRHYVINSGFSILTKYHHYNRNYLVEKKKYSDSVLSTGSVQEYSVDEKDLQLLQEISENARITLLELAKKLKMTATGVKYKLRNLEKNKVIVAYKLLIDQKKLGYEYYKVDLELEDINIIPSLNQFIIQHPNVIYQDIAVGGSDFEFDCELKSQEDFYKLINEIKSLFPGKIRSYFYYKALKIYKYSYFPESLLQKN